jgi:hypothetical protein
LFPVAFRHVTRRGTGSDWSDFWAAGSEAGTKAQLDPAAHRAWGEAHLIAANAFTYMPAAAWLYAPAAHIPLGASFLVCAVATLIVSVLAAVVAAKAFGLAMSFSVSAILGRAGDHSSPDRNSPLSMLLGRDTRVAADAAVVELHAEIETRPGAVIKSPTARTSQSR